MMKRIAVGLVAVLALAACGSSKSSGSGTGSTNPGSKNSGSATTSTGGSDNGFTALVQKAKDAKYKVTYESSDGSGFTLAQDPPRFTMLEGDSATYVTTDGSSISCSGKGASATCTQIPGTGTAFQQAMATVFGAAGQVFTTLANANLGALGALVNISTTNRSIAGRDAECAKIDKSTFSVFASAIGDASFELCVDKETGVMLSTKTTNASGKVDSITATAFAPPSDHDFTPPVTPSTVATPST